MLRRRIKHGRDGSPVVGPGQRGCVETATQVTWSKKVKRGWPSEGRASQATGTANAMRAHRKNLIQERGQFWEAGPQATLSTIFSDYYTHTCACT